MGRFKDFLLERVLFNYSISYVNAEGESKVAKVKASLRNDAMNKFKAMDSTKGYKEILDVRKGDVVTPAQDREEGKE